MVFFRLLDREGDLCYHKSKGGVAMYEYLPKHEKRRERGTAMLLFISGVACFAASLLGDGVLFSLLRLLSYLLLILVVSVSSRYLNRRYSYRAAPSEDSALWGIDLTITEYVGKRVRVVCRIAISDIAEIEHVTRQNHRAIFKRARGNRIYRYTDRMGYENTYLLRISEDDETVYVLILADERLLACLG